MENKLEKESSMDTITTDSTVEEEYVPDTNIEHFLNKRLKEIEEDNKTHERRMAFAESRNKNRGLDRYSKTKEAHFAFRPFLEFFKALGVIY